MPPDSWRPTILCVDDEASIRSALRRVFLEEDWEVHFAKDGEEGLEVFREVEPDLVLSDFRMPGIDGVEFLRRAREINNESVRIVLSGYADTKLVVNALNEGEIYRFIGKPWHDGEMLDIIRKALDHFRTGRENRRLGEELRRLNADLERQVDERTLELQRKNRSLHFVQIMLEMLPMPIVGINAERVIVCANARARKRFDPGGEGLVGVWIADAFPPPLQRAIENALRCEYEPEGQVLPIVFAGSAVGAIVIDPREELAPTLEPATPRRNKNG